MVFLFRLHEVAEMTYFSKTETWTSPDSIVRRHIYKQGADSPVTRAENDYVVEYKSDTSTASTWTPRTGYEEYGPFKSCWISSKRDPYIADGTMLNRLYAKAAEVIRGHDFNAGIAAAEARESLQTVVSAAKFLGSAYKAGSRGDAAGFARAFRDWSTGRSQKLGAPIRGLDIPSAHLNFTYAITPLIADVYSAWEAFTRVASTQTRFTVRHGFKDEGDIGNGPGGYYPPVGYMLTTTKYRSQLIVKVTQSLSQLDSYGLTNWRSII